MKIFQKGFGITTSKLHPFQNITKQVEKIVEQSEIMNGVVHVYSEHTTMAIKITEDCKLAHLDCEHLLVKIAPIDVTYNHDCLKLRDVPPEERINGFAHVRQLFMNTSETIPLVDNCLFGGKWQQIFAIDLDPARERNVFVTVMGE